VTGFLVLLLPLAYAAEVDRAPSGAVVTVRPEEGERLVVVDSRGRELPLPDDVPPMWAVNPASWREAVAVVTELQPLPALVDTLEQTIDACQLDLDTVSSNAAACSEDRAAAQADAKTAKKNRWWWMLFGAVGGAGATAAVTLL